MKKDRAKTIMLRIMLDLFFFFSSEEWADIVCSDKLSKICSRIAVHLGLNQQDCQEVMNRFDEEAGGVFVDPPTLPGKNMEKEEAKTIMLRIMQDLLTADDWEDVLPILEEHLDISERDHEEVMDRFHGELRDVFANQPSFPGSELAQMLAEAEQKKRRRDQE